MTTCTLVIPTKGRITLEDCLKSTQQNILRSQFKIAVVIDSYEMSKEELERILNLCAKYNCEALPHNAYYHDWGYPQLQEYYHHHVTTQFVMNIGDDDVMIEGTMQRILDIINRNGQGHPYMFQAELHASPNRGIPDGEFVLLWNDYDRSIERQKVTGQNLIVPNNRMLMGNWVDDFEFIRQTCAFYKYIQWVPVAICRCY